MSVLAQLAVIFAICLAAEGLAALLPFAFPATVLAMVILLVLLAVRALKPRQLRESSGFLLDHMAMFFVPGCVSLIKYWDVMAANLLPILLITILTTPLVFCVTGHAVQLTIRLLQKRGGDAQ
ncbi:MAG TPA: CidA/LrgA family protein [Candidatus Avoscillospira stercorigallinarum]|uniref:CidA/LrgA family protein n=1 Tax=Candidatus Avoscillospira stercorigallinarum TaxID=2840708 RepID=A0A9D1CNE2_9FIRM|nr:CidA/LrgA family protein [Candidatus Avoscillospira stercorigallinarum]